MNKMAQQKAHRIKLLRETLKRQSCFPVHTTWHRMH